MSHDYILDFWGKYRKRQTRFSDIELRAKDLLKSFVKGTVGHREFASEFDKIRVEFIKLTEDVIDEDTPLWLNSTLFHFTNWHRYQQVKWYFEEHPEDLTGGRKERFEEIQAMGYDERFLSTCKTVLEELSKNQ